MMKVGSWIYGKKANASTQSLDSLSEVQNLDEAMKAATCILNDDVDSAELGLSKGNSAYHQLGKGMVAFVRATLGFEQEIMRQATERLNDAETIGASEHQRAQHNSHAPNAFHSEIYSPGTEYALCQAMAQLMGAVVGVLNESLTESIKAFYKLRRAYIAMDAILKMEEKFMEQKKRSSQLSISGIKNIPRTSTSSSISSKKGLPRSSTVNSSSEPASPLPSTPTNGSNGITHGPESEIFKNEIDIFVHAGANFCFGILNLLISMVPPAFTKLLSIIGFRGDKERGLQMLWQASKFHNLIGALAALALLGYYNGFVRYCDIMPDHSPDDDDSEGYPQEKLAALLVEMRSRFPHSRLWLLEESRMKGANRDLRGALDLLTNSSKSPLKQVEALCVFERSLNAMFLHEYTVCSESFIECVDLNSWSRSLYLFIAGSCQVVLYRQCIASDPKQAEVHAKLAAELIRKAPALAGKKKFMARQLPFDVFVTRKIAKWEARAKDWKVSLVDAIGVDPIEEMIFFWNGYSRMTPSQLEESLNRLAWCESEENKTWSREASEEKATLELMKAAVFRSLHRHEEARKILQTVVKHDKSQFKGNLKDDWVLPAAHFEMAANLWMERPSYQPLHVSTDTEKAEITERILAEPEIEKKKVQECKEYLETVARWDSYELDARIGLKVTAALEAIKKWENVHVI